MKMKVKLEQDNKSLHDADWSAWCCFIIFEEQIMANRWLLDLDCAASPGL